MLSMLELPNLNTAVKWATIRTIGAISILIVGICVSSIGVLMAISKSNSSEVQPCLAPRSSVATESGLKTVQTIQVDVRGEVQKPGLYELAVGSRVGVAIELAGGFTKNADGRYTQREINLAAEMKDGDKLYIPHSGEKAEEVTETAISSVDASDAISINTATQSELESLPGIGEKRAADIIAGRPYGSIDELIDRKIVTQTIYDNILAEISL